MLLAVELERGGREAAEQDRLVAAGADLAQLRLGRLDVGEHTQLRLVVEVLKAGEAARSASGSGDCGWLRNRSSRALAPADSRPSPHRASSAPTVEGEDTPLPVEQREGVVHRGLDVPAHAAGDVDRGPGDVARPVAQQERDQARDLLRRAEAAERNLLRGERVEELVARHARARAAGGCCPTAAS